MAHSKSLFWITITLLSSKMASSFPAAYESDSRMVPAADYDRTEYVAHEQFAFDQDLLSVLPCEGTIIPQENYTSIHTTAIVYDTSLHLPVCKATHDKSSLFTNPLGKTQMIQSPNFPVANKYPANRLYISSFGCSSSGQRPVIDLIVIFLQKPVVYRGHPYCVDYVKIEPQIENHPPAYCGKNNYTGPFHFDEGEIVQVTFRTSQRNNANKGFSVWLHCETSSEAEELDTLLQYLEFPSKSAIHYQRLHENVENSDSVQFESLAKLVNFASHHCKSAGELQVSPYWNIVELALQYEKADDEQVQKIAQDVLQCFPSSQINFARTEMEERK